MMKATRWIPVGGVLAAVLLSGASDLSGQAVEGRVVDAASGAGIPNVLIEVLDEAGERVGAALSDRGGRFRVALQLSGGPFRLEAHALGLGAATVDSLTVSADQVVSLPDIALEMAPIPLDGITAFGERARITSGSEWVRRHQFLGGGTFLSGAVLAATRPGSLGDHIAQASGLRARFDERGSPTLRNPTPRVDDCVLVFVNRWRIERTGYRSLDEIPLEAIAGIEVYNDYFDVPDGYHGDALDTEGDVIRQCGVVQVWLWNSW